jgi:hypothetical protein
MRMNLRHWVLAAALAAGFGGGAALAVPAPFFQGQPDYSKNSKYQQGVREGQDDKAHNKDHSRKRRFKKDEDQKGYEAGYEKGRH